MCNSLQHLQKVAASLVLGRCCSRDDIVKLDWLPIKERREFNYLKLIHKAIHSGNWPDINKVEIKTTGRALRNSDEIKLQTSLINGTFQDEASKYFNQVPTEETLRIFPHSVQPCGIIYLRGSTGNEMTPLSNFITLLTY